MKVVIKVNNIILNNFLEDYKSCVITTSQERSNIPRKDNFDEFKPPLITTNFYLSLKGYEQINNIEIYKSNFKEDCIKIQELFFKTLANNVFGTIGTDYIFIDFDKIIGENK